MTVGVLEVGRSAAGRMVPVAVADQRGARFERSWCRPAPVLPLTVWMLLGFSAGASALNTSIEVAQYKHASWKMRDGFVTPQPPSAVLRDRLDAAIAGAARAVTEGREAVQGLRASTVERDDLAVAIRALGDELGSGAGQPPALAGAVEGQPRDLHPIARDEIFKIAARWWASATESHGDRVVS